MKYILGSLAACLLAGCASIQSRSTSLESNTAGSIAQIYYWRAKPGKFEEYTRYVRDIAEPIDEEAHRVGKKVAAHAIGDRPTRIAAEAGVEDSVEDAQAYLDYLSDGLGDPVRAREFLALADAAILFLRNRVDIDLRLVRGFPDYYFGRTPAAKPDGRYIEAAPFPLGRLAELRERFVDERESHSSFSFFVSSSSSPQRSWTFFWSTSKAAASARALSFLSSSLSSSRI